MIFSFHEKAREGGKICRIRGCYGKWGSGQLICNKLAGRSGKAEGNILRRERTCAQQQKQKLYQMHQHCVLTTASIILRAMGPVRPHLCRNVSSVLTQHGVLQMSRLGQTLPLVASSSSSCSLFVACSVHADISGPSCLVNYSQPELIPCFSRHQSAGHWARSTFCFSHLTCNVSRLTGLVNS